MKMLMFTETGDPLQTLENLRSIALENDIKKAELIQDSTHNGYPVLVLHHEESHVNPIRFSLSCAISYNEEDGLHVQYADIFGSKVGNTAEDLVFSLFNSVAYNELIQASGRDFLSYAARYWYRYRGDFPHFHFQLSRKLAGNGSWFRDSETEGHWESDVSNFSIWFDAADPDKVKFGFDKCDKSLFYELTEENLLAARSWIEFDFLRVKQICDSFIRACENIYPVSTKEVTIPNGIKQINVVNEK